MSSDFNDIIRDCVKEIMKRSYFIDHDDYEKATEEEYDKKDKERCEQ